MNLEEKSLSTAHANLVAKIRDLEPTEDSYVWLLTFHHHQRGHPDLYRAPLPPPLHVRRIGEKYLLPQLGDGFVFV